MNILLVDDHKIMIDGLKMLFENESDIQVNFEAQTGEQALRMVADHEIDIVLLDINLPDISGFEVCKGIKSIKPAVKVIALTMHDEAGYISKMAKVGVDGYILKNTGKGEIMRAIDTVMNDEKYYSAEVTKSLILGTPKERKPKSSDFIQKLTRREKEILQLIVDEMTTDEMAKKLFISSTTVISHRKSLLRKLNAKNSAGLVKKAYEFGLLK